MPANPRQKRFLLRFFSFLILFYVVITPRPVVEAERPAAAGIEEEQHRPLRSEEYPEGRTSVYVCVASRDATTFSLTEACSWTEKEMTSASATFTTNECRERTLRRANISEKLVGC